MKNLVKDIQDIQYISEISACLRIDLKIYNRDVTFLTLYALTDDLTTQMKEMFYEMF